MDLKGRGSARTAEYPSIYLEGLRKTVKIHTRRRRCLGRDSNQMLSKMKNKTLLPHHRVWYNTRGQRTNKETRSATVSSQNGQLNFIHTSFEKSTKCTAKTYSIAMH